jgi:hypothetical protein
MDTQPNSPLPERSVLDRFKASTTWNIVQIILPLIAIAVPIILFTIGKSNREVSVVAIQATALVNTTDVIAKDLSVSYGGTRVANVLRYLVEIRNTGNISIDGRDIHYLRWLPPPKTRVLAATVTKKTPGYGEFISLVTANDSVEFRLLTLNRDATATIDILCAAEVPLVEDPPRVEGAITDAKVVDMSSAANTAQSKPPFFGEVFAGPIRVQLVKLLSYSFVGIVLLFLVGISWDKLSELQKRKRSVRIAKEFMITHSIPSAGDMKYVEYWAETLKYLASLNREQLLFLKNTILGSSGYDYIDIPSLIDGRFNERDRATLKALPDHDLLKKLLGFTSLYQTKTLCDAFLAVHGKKP